MLDAGLASRHVEWQTVVPDQSQQSPRASLLCKDPATTSSRAQLYEDQGDLIPEGPGQGVHRYCCDYQGFFSLRAIAMSPT